MSRLLSVLKRVYAALPWGIIALGVLHMTATWRIYDQLTTPALWFFSGGIVLLFTGILNLINRREGAGAPALRWFTRGANVIILGFSTLSGVVGGASAVELAVVLGLLGATTLLSFGRYWSA